MINEFNTLDAAYWNKRFKSNDTPWDIGYPSSPLSAYFNQLTNKNISILIPGCGNAWEAQYLLEKDFTNIALIDIAPIVIRQLSQKFESYHNQLTLMNDDFFTMEGQYDLIIEQTFFCALAPSLRPHYVQKMANLLTPSGKLVGLLFNRHFNERPPFGGLIEEYKKLFEKKMNIKIMEECYNSIQPRTGTELFFIATK